ncbi:MAG: DUF364 domain-containing protein [Desulfosarcinaceae bacterium]
MQILDALIERLSFDAPVEEIRQGVFHTAVLTRHCGLAATLPKDALKQSPPLVGDAGFLLDKNAEQLSAMAYSESLLEAAIGMAAVNSLIEFDAGACLEANALDLIMKHGTDKKVAIVGHFPFIPKVRSAATALWVIENNPAQGDLRADQADEFIPQADVVAITGTSLTNHSLPQLLTLCAPRAFVIMLGDTVPLCPVLFDFGVDALCGTQVLDAEKVLRCISQGANFRQIRGTRRLTLLKP